MYSELKHPVGSWEVTEFNRGDFQIDNEKGENVADVFSNVGTFDPEKFPDLDKAKFNAELISRAPIMAKRLLEIRQGLIDRKEFEIFVKGIDVALEGLTV